jgi:hypothetical protein
MRRARNGARIRRGSDQIADYVEEKLHLRPKPRIRKRWERTGEELARFVNPPLPPPPPGKIERPEKRDPAELLRALFRGRGGRLFRAQDGRGFAAFEGVAAPVESRDLRLYLQGIFHDFTGRAIPKQKLDDATAIMLAEATFEYDKHCKPLPVFLRGGETVTDPQYTGGQHTDRIYLDLADGTGRAVEIDATGWRVIDNVTLSTGPDLSRDVEYAPCDFRRPLGVLPLPEPRRGGDLRRLLRPLLNLGEGGGRRALLGPGPVVARRGAPADGSISDLGQRGQPQCGGSNEYESNLRRGAERQGHQEELLDTDRSSVREP